MKSLMIASLLVLQSVSGFALSPRSADLSERRLLCKSVQSAAAQAGLSVRVLVNECIESNVQASEVGLGDVTLVGRVSFIANGKKQTQECELTYAETPLSVNIIGGIEKGVTCQTID